MTLPRCLARVALALGALVGFSLPARATVNYSISLAQPDQHRFHVRMTIPNVTGNVQVQMAAWDELYQIRDFAMRVIGLHAEDASGPASVEKLNVETWNIKATSAVTVEYDVEWNDSGPFSSQLNRDHAFLNFATVLLYVPTRHSEDVRVQFQDVPPNWNVAVELHPDPADASGKSFLAPSFDALADAPAELGSFDDFSFYAGGRNIRVVVHGKGWNRGDLTDWLTRVANYETSLMGGAPDREYLFILHIGFIWGGGMEHSDCTAISVALAAQLPDTAAHEFFHQWNVKRLRPQSLEPLDRTREMPTKALWFAEGVTNTYAHYTLVRTGLFSPQQFYDELGLEISASESRPAHLWQSVEESSLDAWYEKYPMYAEGDFSVSYYDKGDVVGVMLDILMRHASGNRVGLDDLMRQMYDDFAKKGRFYNDSTDIRATAEALLRKAGVPAANADLSSFFSQYVSGAKEIPLADILAEAGLDLHVNDGGTGPDYRITEMSHPNDLQRRIRDGLLHGTTSNP
jgi:predicted metalloprotease with PDZ domain